MKTTNKGKLIVISGPSGVGKGTIVKKIIENKKNNCMLSISVTSRPIRDYEKEGREYYFMDKNQIEALIEENAFLEYAKYAGNYYGTLEKKVQKNLDEGKNVILEIEVQGAMQVKSKHQDVKLIFVKPPTIQDLYERLKIRDTEENDVINHRVEIAKKELELEKSYDFTVVNDDLEKCTKEIEEYINAL